jgi:TetR/AcrR family transcriptional regulator, transcriptional repressor of bet genes
MGLTPIKDIRRQELLDAAFESIKKHGIQATTIASIAEEAGVSKGTIHHYFKNREELIELAVRRIFTMRHADVLNKLKVAKTPSERLWAVVSVNLDPRYLGLGFCRAWISIAAEVTENVRFARLLRVHHARERSNLIHALHELGHEPNVNSVALGLKLLFEGARHRAGFLTKKLTAEEEKMHVLAYLGACAPKFDQSAAKQQ